MKLRLWVYQCYNSRLGVDIILKSFFISLTGKCIVLFNLTFKIFVIFRNILFLFFTFTKRICDEINKKVLNHNLQNKNFNNSYLDNEDGDGLNNNLTDINRHNNINKYSKINKYNNEDLDEKDLYKENLDKEDLDKEDLNKKYSDKKYLVKEDLNKKYLNKEDLYKKNINNTFFENIEVL